jgi:hypothetical protein
VGADHPAHATPLAPQLRTGEPTGLLVQQPERLQRLAEYLATVNPSATETFPYQLKTLRRVGGRGTRALVTTYKLPRQTDQPHDVMVDPDGGVYFTYFGDPLLGRLDPRTDEVTSFPVPIPKQNAAKGTLSLARDHDGNYWISLMYQAGAAKFDKASKSFTMSAVAPEFNRDSSQQAFVAPQSSHVDGKLWIQDVASTSVYRVDLKSGKFENFAPFKAIKPDSPLAGRPHSIYEIFPDTRNNLYIADFSDRAIGRIDAETGEYSLRPDLDRSLAAAPRRIRQGRAAVVRRIRGRQRRHARHHDQQSAGMEPAHQVVDALPGQGRPQRRRLGRRNGGRPYRADQFQDRRDHGISAAGQHQYPQPLCQSRCRDREAGAAGLEDRPSMRGDGAGRYLGS